RPPPGQESADLVAARSARAGRRTAMKAIVDGDAVRAPAPGWFHRRIEPDHLVAPGDVIGELEILGRTVRVTADVRGIAKLPTADLRRAVGYGDVLFEVVRDAAPEAVAAPVAQASNVFRAPTSGRFYGRP